MGSTRLRCFYLANKTTLDTRFDLVVALLTHISVKMESPSAASPPQRRVYWHVFYSFTGIIALTVDVIHCLLLNESFGEKLKSKNYKFISEYYKITSTN